MMHDYFMQRVHVTDTCWLWMMSTNLKGYGFFWDPEQKKLVYAHRYAYELFVGPVPDDMLVCHTCDTPPCVHPEHLFLGTNTDNMQDMISKGRSPVRAGVSNPRARLTEDDVHMIRSLYKNERVSQSQIARAYGIAQQTVSAIVTRTNWQVC